MMIEYFISFSVLLFVLSRVLFGLGMDVSYAWTDRCFWVCLYVRKEIYLFTR